MAAPAFRLRPYKISFIATLNPSENQTILNLNIGSKLLYTAGNSVLIINETESDNKFEAIVTSYNIDTGFINLEQITNIHGSNFGGPKKYTINLCGERGSTILTGTGVPSSSVGRLGDIFIDLSSGNLLIKI